MSKLYDYDKDDFELSFLVPEVEEEATEQELAGVRHAMFDWAAGGADDLQDEPEEEPQVPGWGPVEEEPEEPSQSGLAASQLSQRESQGVAGVPESDGQLASPFGGGGIAQAMTERAQGRAQPAESAAWEERPHSPAVPAYEQDILTMDAEEDSGWMTLEDSGWQEADPAPAEPQWKTVTFSEGEPDEWEEPAQPAESAAWQTSPLSQAAPDSSPKGRAKAPSQPAERVAGQASPLSQAAPDSSPKGRAKGGAGVSERDGQLASPFGGGGIAQAMTERAQSGAQPAQNSSRPAGRSPNGHTVVISGGDRGIGAAAARLFWQQGYRTAVLYHTNEAAARALINELGSDCVAVKCDVADRAACEAAWKVVQRVLGEPDVLVCNAGIAQQKLFTDITEADWQRMIGVDLTGVFHLCQLALPAMIRKKYGRILTVSSMWGQTGGSCEVHYSAAKAGVIGLTKALAKEEGPSGITVNCVAPGVVDTEMMAGFTPEDKAALAEETPVMRLGTPEDIARVLVFLAGENAGFITGQVWGVNGGLVI